MSRPAAGGPGEVDTAAAVELWARHGEKALGDIADWGPTQDWNDWADARGANALRAATGC